MVKGNIVKRQNPTNPGEAYIYEAHVIAESHTISDHFIVSASSVTNAWANAADEFMRRTGLFAGTITLTQLTQYPAVK